MPPITRNITKTKQLSSKSKPPPPSKSHATLSKPKSASQKNHGSLTINRSNKASNKKTSRQPKVDFTNTKSVSSFISSSSDIFSNTDVTRHIRQLNSNSALYVASAHNSVRRVFSILLNHPSLSGLAEMVTDPLSDSQESNLVILTRGVKTRDKYNILNTCLLAVALELKKKTHSNVNLTKR